MVEKEWVSLLEVYDRLEAEILKEALDAQGIPAQLFQEAVSHYLYPVGGPMGRIEVCVSRIQHQEALNWLEAYNNGGLRNDEAQSMNPGNDE